jgi:Glycogen recognition site of AMP-activated protein kinase
MTDSELHPYVELIAREARRPVVFDSAARDRVMAAVRAQPLPRRWRFWGALEPRSLMVSPLAGTLLAAGLFGVGVLLGGLATNRDGREPAGQLMAVVQRLPVSDTVFVFVAPRASKVSLVGDFNDWDDTKAPLVRVPNSGLWRVTLPLPAGRHEYQFVVDGAWLPDPSAPVAGDDGFGRTNSVRIVRKGSAL